MSRNIEIDVVLFFSEGSFSHASDQGHNSSAYFGEYLQLQEHDGWIHMNKVLAALDQCREH